MSIIKDKILINQPLQNTGIPTATRPIPTAQAALVPPPASLAKSPLRLLPKDIIWITIKQKLSLQDHLVLSCVCKHFNVMFKDTAQLLMDEVRGCKTLSSMKTLRKHVEDLNAHYPMYLGAEKPWTIPRVLYFYSLKTVDFSEEGISTEDVELLLTAFADIIRNEQPLRTVEMDRRTDYFYIARAVFALNPAQLVRVSQLAHIPLEYIAEKHRELAIQVTYALLELPRMQVAEIFHTVLGNTHEEMTFIKESYTQKIFGDIETFNVGLNHDLFGWPASMRVFFNAFCPRLKVLVMPFNGELHQCARIFFLTENRRNVLTRFQTNPSTLIDSELSWDLYELFLQQENLENAGDSFGPSDPKDLIRLAKACPHLSQLCISMGKLKNSSSKKEIQNALSETAKSCPNITSLSINTFPSDLDKDLLLDIAKTFPKLKELTLVFEPKAYMHILSFLERCPQLIRLNLKIKDSNDADIDLHQKLPRICPLQPNLEHFSIALHVDHELLIDDEQVVEAVQMTKLKPCTIYEMLRRLPNLTSFVTSPNLYLPPVPDNIEKHLGDICKLRIANKKLKEPNCSGRDILTYLQNATEDTYRQNFDALYLNGLAADIPSAEKLLKDDIRLLKRCRRPVFSIKGNILEQQMEKTFLLIQKELIDNEKGNMTPFDYEFKLLNWNNTELRMHLQVFDALLKDKSCPQKLLHYYYTSYFFTPEDREALETYLQRLTNYPGYVVRNIIEKNARYLSVAVQGKLASLESEIVPFSSQPAQAEESKEDEDLTWV